MNVVITGANRGIGLELVKQFNDKDYNVYGSSRNPLASTELQEEIGLDKIIPLDMSDTNSIETFCKQIQNLTNSKIDILINNAAVRGEKGNPGIPDPNVIRETFNINAIGPVMLIKYLADSLHGTKIINITSGMGSISRTTSGDLSYRMSKAALNMAGRNLHIEMKEHNTIIVQIHPGWVRTDMGGMNAAISTEESAKGIINSIENLSPNQSGTFFDYKGDQIPW
ncbi:MAG TPA: SDR family oxidoreductase [Dehalococcoidia bacterium]|mgnify:FL=1|jgi:NAD(P)-dependent dehydrogenase (short-subunit alcohol dehydrogenase family)|nr:SDR family oxidoreductase [Dehalococcoidia bacterium]